MTSSGRPSDDDPPRVVDPVVVDLDAPEPEPGDAPAPTGRSPHFRTFATVAVLVGVLALGVFIGNLNARNTAANNLRVVPGDLFVTEFHMNDSQWNASLTVINDGEQPVDVVGVDSPGLKPAMITETVTVPPDERVAADMTLSPDCDVLAPPDTDAAVITERPLALEVTTEDGEYTVETPVAIAPARAVENFNAACRQNGTDLQAQLEVITTNDSRPDGSLPTRATVRVHDEDVEGDVINMRSHLPGFALTTDSLPAPVEESTAVIELTWTVDDCALATSSGAPGYQSDIGVSIRAETDGVTTERIHQQQLPRNVVLQLGLLAASSCPS